MVTWVLIATNVVTLVWGQHWKNIAWRITDVVNDILSDEDDDDDDQDIPGGLTLA